jgi:hypothetical protein
MYMEKLVAIAFYVVVGAGAIGAAWAFDASQNQPTASAAEVKSQSIELEASDFDESKNLKDAVERLSKPVQKPTTSSNIDQLQPAVKNQDATKLP